MKQKIKVRKPNISIIVPVFNEEENILNIIIRITTVFKKLPEYSYEIIFTDNRSTDQTFSKIESFSKNFKNIKAVRFSRNFGYQKSIYSGYLLAAGDAVIQIDGDLQDPPELIPDFLNFWKSGYKIVYGIRKKRMEGFMITFMRKVFYRMINWLSEDELPLDAGDFRLVDREVIDKAMKYSLTSSPYIRGQLAIAGFNQRGFEYERSAREKGESKFNLKKLVLLALDGIVNHSIKPLRMASFFALLISIFLIAATLFYIFGKFFFGAIWPSGFATTTVLILLGILFNALFLGILGEYIGRIFLELKKNPFVVIENSINIPENQIDRFLRK